MQLGINKCKRVRKKLGENDMICPDDCVDFDEQEILDKLDKFIKRGVDAKTLLESNEYIDAIQYLPSDNVLMGYEIELHGDIRRIIYGAFNSVRIVCTFRNYSLLKSCEDAYVNVPLDLVPKMIALKLRTDTQVRLKVRILDFIYNRFELVDIFEYNRPLMFPYYICSNCGAILGINRQNVRKGLCEHCGSVVNEVFDIYKEGFVKDIYSNE